MGNKRKFLDKDIFSNNLIIEMKFLSFTNYGAWKDEVNLSEHQPANKKKREEEKSSWNFLKPFLSSLCPLAMARSSFLFFPTT